MLIQLINLIIYIILFSRNICNGSHSSIQVENGYKGIVIAFSPEIEINKRSEIIDKTKELVIKASEILYNSTARRAQFTEVIFVVPNTWTEYNNSDSIPYTRYSDADIIITEKESDAQSFSMQFGGCGERALPIVMSKELVLGTGDKYGDSAKLLVHEWAHYRYGVFNEFGFPGDPLYPAYYSIPGNDKIDIHVTACTDGQDSFNYTIDNCIMSTDNNTGLPDNPQCVPIPDINFNSMQSSLMYSQAINSVTKFCGSDESNKIVHNHNVNSPNKQNVLCNGRDTWSVIKKHLDSETSSMPIKKDPIFKIWRDSTPRTLIAIAKSDVMLSLQRNKWINFAIQKYTKIDLPKSMAAFFTYNGEDTDVTNPPPNNFWNTADQLNTRIIFSGTAQKIDFEKILLKGKEVFYDKSGGTFIIVIGGIGIKPNNIEKISKELRAANIKLKIIVYPIFESIDDRRHASDLFKTAISITGGSVDYIKEDVINYFKKKTSASTLTQLLNAFESVKTDFSGDFTKSHYMISEKVFDKLQNTVSFNFNVDTTISNKQLRAYFIQSKISNDDILDILKLKDPNGVNNYVLSNIDLTNTIRGFIVDKPDITGQWELSANVINGLIDLSEESVVAIAEFEPISSSNEVITAKCWLSSHTSHDPSKPLLIYVQVLQGIDGLIEDAYVEYILNYEKTQNSNINIHELLDDGLGDPDITKGDGIYSQYIVDIRNGGYYFITARVNGKVKVTKNFGSTSLGVRKDFKSCCGSKIEGDSNEIYGNISRIINCGSILITDNWQTDKYPPNTIRDLRIERVDYFNRTVDILWTSPGGDYSFNSVNRYEVKVFHGKDKDSDLRNDIKNNFDSKGSADVVIQPISAARKYGEQQRTNIRINSEEGGMYYFAIKSFDNQNHGSEVSNIVVAYIKSNVPLITSTTALSNDVSKAPVTGSGSGSTKLAGMEWWEILVICIAIILVLVFIIIISICCVSKRRRKSEESERKVEQPPQRRAPDPPRISPTLLKSENIHSDDTSLTHSVEKIPNINTYNNTNNNYNSGSEQNLRELNVSALSPVQSWDAKDLLSHWGRVQEAKQRQETPPVMRIEDIESGSSNHSPSYASSEDDNTYTTPGTWRYTDLDNTGRHSYAPNPYPEPAFRSSLDPLRSSNDPLRSSNDPLRSNTPSDNSVPRYSSVVRKPTTTVSQV